jgi:altronate dehydratase small subunit
MKQSFKIHDSDNVATLIEDANAEPVRVFGATKETVITLIESMPLGHKVALSAIEPGGLVIKYGIPIGTATREIRPGEWVHLHNCRSQVDERSSTLDFETGAATDTVYE